MNNILGILGGGQLGRMLIQKCIDYSIEVHVLEPDAEAPCKDICAGFEVGDITDFDTVYNFGKKVEVLTIEIERVNVMALYKLQEEGIKVFPQPEVIELIQDKGIQKDFFYENKIPTATYQIINSLAEMDARIFKMPFVQKLRKDGYDGKGVKIIRTEADVNEAFTAPSIVERAVDIDKEIAIIVARNTKGDIKVFPTVEMEFHPEANLVEYLHAPANIPVEINETAQAIAYKIVEKLEIVGILAVEMFITKDGQVLVNELAPRPHNSGHHTIEANVTSQYEQHLRCILGLPLGSTDTVFDAVMVNVLGEQGHTGKTKYVGLEEILAEEGVFVHLYGKKTTKPFRKIGHATIIGANYEETKRKADFVKKTLKVISA